MSLILKMKHWILFILLVVPSLFASIISEPNQTSQFEILANLVTAIVYFVWVLTINIYLYNEARIIHNVLFVVCFIFVFAFYLCFNMYLLIEGVPKVDNLGYYKLIIFGLTIYCLAVTSKRLKSREQSRTAKFGEYFLYIILLFVFPIGVWVLQPKINRIHVSD